MHSARITNPAPSKFPARRSLQHIMLARCGSSCPDACPFWAEDPSNVVWKMHDDDNFTGSFASQRLGHPPNSCLLVLTDPLFSSPLVPHKNPPSCKPKTSVSDAKLSTFQASSVLCRQLSAGRNWRSRHPASLASPPIQCTECCPTVYCARTAQLTRHLQERRKHA